MENERNISLGGTIQKIKIGQWRLLYTHVYLYLNHANSITNKWASIHQKNWHVEIWFLNVSCKWVSGILIVPVKLSVSAVKARVIHLTKSWWPNEYEWTMTMTNLNNWTWPKFKLTNLMKPTNLNFMSRVLLTSVPDVFFLVEERSEAGQVPSQCKLASQGWGDLSKPTAPA